MPIQEIHAGTQNMLLRISGSPFSLMLLLRLQGEKLTITREELLAVFAPYFPDEDLPLEWSGVSTSSTETPTSLLPDELDRLTEQKLSLKVINWRFTGLSDRAWFGLRDLNIVTVLDIYQNRKVLETLLWQKIGASRTTLREIREWALAYRIQLEPCEAAQPEPVLSVEEIERLRNIEIADTGLRLAVRKALSKLRIYNALDVYEKCDDLLWYLSKLRGVGKKALSEVFEWTATVLRIQLNKQVAILSKQI